MEFGGVHAAEGSLGIRGGAQQLWGCGSAPWHQLLSSPLSCLGHQMGAGKRGTDGGQWQRPHVIQTAQAAAEADLRPVAGLVRE